MNMSESITAMDVIVLVAVAFAVVFVAAWSASPALRAWIERPKYRFQKDVQTYDRRGRPE
jgi:hypothetical protein